MKSTGVKEWEREWLTVICALRPLPIVQLNKTRRELEAMHSRYCPESSYSATSKRTCGTQRPQGRHLFRVAAKGVLAARRLWRLRNGYSLDGTLADLGPAVKVPPLRSVDINITAN
jgi:hypothetical protein